MTILLPILFVLLFIGFFCYDPLSVEIPDRSGEDDDCPGSNP